MRPYNASELQLAIRLHYLKKNDRKKNCICLEETLFSFSFLFLAHSGLGQETSMELLDTVALLFQIKKRTKEKFFVF